MIVKFLKMHGLGNDFVIIDQRNHEFELSTQDIKLISNRHFGIGCDQVVIMRKAPGYDCRIIIYNADGSTSPACGNATRCVGSLLDARKSRVVVHNRILHIEKLESNLIKVNMGIPMFEWYEIPLSKEVDPLFLPFNIEGYELGAAVNVGNPHVVFFVTNLETVEVAELGPYFENHPLFPTRINVSFAEIVDEHNIKVRVWERGVGETNACGSAACATHAIAHKLKLVGDMADIHLTGGTLKIIQLADKTIEMTGEVAKVFTGEIKL